MKFISKSILNKGSEHFFYVGATLVSAGIHFLYSVYVKIYIDPIEYGMYSTCLLLTTYFSYIQLGSLNAFNRDYPQLIGAENKEQAKRYRDTTFTYLLIVFLLFSIILSCVFIIIGKIKNLDSRYTFGFLLCIIITTINIFENFLSNRVRIEGNFKYTSLVMILKLISIAVGLILVPRVGYYSLYIVTIFGGFISIFMYYKRGLSDLSLKMDRPLLRTIIISGIPLLIYNLIWTVVDSIDKFVILTFLNPERLGVYSIAQMAFSYMVLIPSAMSQLFYVNLGKIYGASGSKEKLNSTAIKYTLIIAEVMSFFVLIAFYFIKPLVSLVMPKYNDGTTSAQILMLALAIYTPTMVNGNILTILQKNAALLRSSIYLCVLNAICSLGFVYFRGANIESVALGTATSYLIRTVILIIQLKREANASVLSMLKASLVPVILTVGPGVAIYFLRLNIWVRFSLTLVTAIVVFFIFYRKYIKEVLSIG